MTTEVAAAIVGGASAIGGGLIVAVSNYGINRAQARDAQRADLERVLTSFVALVNRIDHQLRVEPNPGRFVRWLNDQVAKFPQFDYTIGQVRRRLLEPQTDLLVIGLHESMAAVLLGVPAKLLATVEELVTLMSEAKPADDGWREQWDAARSRLITQSRGVFWAPRSLPERVLRRRGTSP